MKLIRLNEDRRPQNLFVCLSSKLSSRILEICAYNKDNSTSVKEWYGYIEGIKRYVSNTAIAWDNMNRYPCLPNGGRFINDFDCGVGYIIKINKKTNLGTLANVRG